MNRLLILVFILSGLNLSIFGHEPKCLSKEYYNLNSLGFAHSEYDTISNGLYPGFYKIYSQAVSNTFSEDIKEIKYFNELFRFESIDTNKIKSFCLINNLDALLISKVYFLSRDFVYKGFLGLEKIYNPHLFQQGLFCFYVEIKMFDKYGNLILNSTATSLNGYDANKSLTNGFKKALKKAKEQQYITTTKISYPQIR
jgi:hypothetical protein